MHLPAGAAWAPLARRRRTPHTVCGSLQVAHFRLHNVCTAHFKLHTVYYTLTADCTVRAAHKLRRVPAKRRKGSVSAALLARPPAAPKNNAKRAATVNWQPAGPVCAKEPTRNTHTQSARPKGERANGPLTFPPPAKLRLVSPHQARQARQPLRLLSSRTHLLHWAASASKCNWPPSLAGQAPLDRQANH